MHCFLMLRSTHTTLCSTHLDVHIEHAAIKGRVPRACGAQGRCLWKPVCSVKGGSGCQNPAHQMHTLSRAQQPRAAPSGSISSSTRRHHQPWPCFAPLSRPISFCSELPCTSIVTPLALSRSISRISFCGSRLRRTIEHPRSWRRQQRRRPTVARTQGCRRVRTVHEMLIAAPSRATAERGRHEALSATGSARNVCLPAPCQDRGACLASQLSGGRRHSSGQRAGFGGVLRHVGSRQCADREHRCIQNDERC